ncbi:MAG TPA: hypothetical protein V6D29_20550 [Leptolyngbyaceae cyanobacterium]
MPPAIVGLRSLGIDIGAIALFMRTPNHAVCLLISNTLHWTITKLRSDVLVGI